MGEPAAVRVSALVGLVVGRDLRSVDESDDLVGVDPGDGGQGSSHLVVVVEEQRRVEVGQLRGPEDVPFASRSLPAGM